MKFVIYLILTTSLIISQNHISADPYSIFGYELKQFNKLLPYHSTSIRPFFYKIDKKITIRVKNEIYLNNNASNQENMDVRYFGKGIGSFTSLEISGYSKFFAFNFEPYKLTSSKFPSRYYDRPSAYKFLNDSKTNNNLKDLGLRKADIYFHYNGLGIGITKDNMWWGPGLQGSFSMTNNTSGFKNYMIGTIKELKWKNIGFMGRYTFSELNQKKGYEATYFTALTAQATI